MSSLLTTWGKQYETQALVQEFNETILPPLPLHASPARAPSIHMPVSRHRPDAASEPALLLYLKELIIAQILL